MDIMYYWFDKRMRRHLPGRHNYGVHRMLKAGVTPITWMSLAFGMDEMDG